MVTVGKKPAGQTDHIAEALKPKTKKQLYKLTVKIDQELYERAAPLLDGKFSALMEGAIREALERIKTGKAG
jgi:post-segregation antitoxin (ccd killing protein)